MLGSGDGAVVKHAARAGTRALVTERGFSGPEKKNPAVGTPGQIFFVIGVYGFKYAAWLLLVYARRRGAALLLLSSRFLFLFFYFLVLL